MKSNPDWRVHFYFNDPSKGVSISLKHLLFWLVKAAFLLPPIFGALTVYSWFLWGTPTTQQWMYDVNEHFASGGVYENSFIMSWIDYDFIWLWPFILALLVVAVLVALVSAKNFRPVALKSRKRSLIIAIAMLSFCVVFNNILCSGLSRFSTFFFRDFVPLLDSNLYNTYEWPLQYTFYFSLLFALTYHLVKLCTLTLRRKPKAGVETASVLQ